jgi:hypothetical protein
LGEGREGKRDGKEKQERRQATRILYNKIEREKHEVNFARFEELYARSRDMVFLPGASFPKFPIVAKCYNPAIPF